MRIAICDDELEQVRANVNLIQEWATKRQFDINIDTFSSAEAFLYRWSEGYPHDLAILDIKMKAMTGMELAKTIRKKDNDLQILFITGIEENALEGYDVSALNYLIKPFEPTKFTQILDKAYNVFMQKEAGALLVSQERQFIRVPYPEIIYLEIYGHYFTIHTITMGTFRMKKKMDDMLALLDKRLFIQCHRSSIINVSHISNLSRQAVTLKSDLQVSLSAPHVQSVTQLFAEYHYQKNISF